MSYTKSSLAYCSNVHPGADLESVLNNIEQHFAAVKNRRNLTQMASGLWLSSDVAQSLSQDPKVFARFKQQLADSGVALTSLNGFPFGDFHQAVVKQNVYLPTWAEHARLEYTKTLASILAKCLPSNENKGAISTLPLAYAKGWTAEQHQTAIRNLLILVQFLAELEDRTGKQIVIGIEMEPDCVLQHTHELVSFFKRDLMPAAKDTGISQGQLNRYLGCCFDTCHQAVMGEDISQSLHDITSADIQLGKIQISNAVKAHIHTQEQIFALTDLFADKKFLHQTKVFSDNTMQCELADLNASELNQALQSKQIQDSPEHALEQGPLEATIHYHIPVNQSAADLPLEFLHATQYAILQTLDFLQAHTEYRPCLEIETYTWLNFLQEEADKNARLHTGFEQEFKWLEASLEHRGMLSD